jgi:hypothetical protein
VKVFAGMVVLPDTVPIREVAVAAVAVVDPVVENNCDPGVPPDGMVQPVLVAPELSTQVTPAPMKLRVVLCVSGVPAWSIVAYPPAAADVQSV